MNSVRLDSIANELDALIDEIDEVACPYGGHQREYNRILERMRTLSEELRC